MRRTSSARRRSSTGMRMSKPFSPTVRVTFPKTSLLREMMNREDGRKRQPLLAHQQRDKRRDPVVRMEDLGRRRHPPRQLDRGFAEEKEARGVIGIRLAFLAIKCRAIEELI